MTRAVTGASAALCVLGCRSNSPALARRAHAGRDAFLAGQAVLVVACGGISWAGQVEADEIARILAAGGIPEDRIVRERLSRDTVENATFTARLLGERGIGEVILVTCSWHLPRATRLFGRAGLSVVGGIGVPPPNPTMRQRLWWAARERVAAAKDVVHRALGPGLGR
jgi:uncharacterized SAM-binding protein YcdF (DUF218 family)